MINKLKQKAEENGYQLTDNAEKIANAKSRFFTPEEWERCPCDRNSDRACISDRCKQEIEANGICHCSLYRKVLF